MRPRVDGLGEIVLGFYFLWGGVAQCFMKPRGVLPMHPPQGGQFDFSDRHPGTVSMNEFSFVEAVDCLG